MFSKLEELALQVTEAVVQRCSVKKMFLEIWQNLRWNICARLIFNKVASLSHANLLKKRLWHRCFHVNFVKFLRTSFFIEHSVGCFWGKSFDSVVRLVLRFFQYFKYAYVFLILVFLYLVWFVCFYELLNRGVFSENC